MNRFNEATLSQALHSAVDELPVDSATFDRVASRVARRRRTGLAGGAVAVAFGVGVGVGVGVAQPGQSGAAVGAGAGTPTPGTSMSAKPGTGAEYCPASDAGTIQYPSIDSSFTGVPSDTSRNLTGPVRIPFTADRVIICRFEYGGTGTLVGSALVTKASTVQALEHAVNTTGGQVSSDPCPTTYGAAYIWFLSGRKAVYLNLDLLSCNAWIQPESILITGNFIPQVMELTTNWRSVMRRRARAGPRPRPRGLADARAGGPVRCGRSP